MAQAIDPSRTHKRYRFWLVVAGWMTAALIQAVALDASAAAPFEAGFPNGVFSHAVLGVLVWQVCRAHAYLELWKRRPLRAVSVHATAGVVALAIWSVAEVTYTRLLYGEDFWPLVYANSWALQLLSGALLYAAAVGLGVIVQSFDREQLRRQREAELELVARDAELTAIKSQLQPHFLLNSLNSILALVEHDPARASAMLERLASFLQSGFDRLDEPLVLLRRELDTVRDYLKIEQVGFADRLRFTIEADGDTEQVSVLLGATVNLPLVAVENCTLRGVSGVAGRSMLVASPTAMERGADARMGDEDVVEALPVRGNCKCPIRGNRKRHSRRLAVGGLSLDAGGFANSHGATLRCTDGRRGCC